MKDCVFCKIANGEIPKEFEYEDKDVMVFKDIHPIKPVHLLVVPKKHIEEMLEANSKLTAVIFEVVKKMVKKTNLEDKGYRITINGGGAQFIDHFHIHLTGPMGQKAGW